MADSSRTEAEPSLPAWINSILDAGYLSHRDHFQLVSLVLSELKTTAAERQMINGVFDEVQSGRLPVRD